MTDLAEWLLAQIDADEQTASRLLADLEAQIRDEGYGTDVRGPMTPARILGAQLWAHYDGQTRWRNFARGQHIADLASPARVLAECDAKRRIVELHRPVGYHDRECSSCGYNAGWGDMSAADWPCDVLRLLALPYADRDGYRPEWLPDEEIAAAAAAARAAHRAEAALGPRRPGDDA